MTNYDSFSLCNLAEIFFAMHVAAKQLMELMTVAKELNISIEKQLDI